MTAQSPAREPASDIDSMLAKAATLINAGQNTKATDLLKLLFIRDPAPDPRADYMLGVAAFRSGDPHTAVGAFRRYVAAKPLDGEAQYGLGTALLAQGDRDGARRALADAVRADPGLAAARTRLNALTSEGAVAMPGRPGSTRNMPPPGETKEAEPAAESLADLLDRRAPARPDPDELTGRIVWKGRSDLRSIIAPTVAPFLLLLVPPIVRGATKALPAGPAREALAQLWRFTWSAALPLAIVLAAVSVASWLMREFVLRERRIEVWTGLFGRRHVVLWLHDLERPPVVRQRLWQLGLNLGTLEISSTILPAPKRRRSAMRLGHMRLSGLPIGDAEKVAVAIWSRSLWERRRMVQNFVSTR